MGKTRFGFGVRHEAEMPQHKASMPIPFKQKTDYSHLFENRYSDIPKNPISSTPLSAVRKNF